MGEIGEQVGRVGQRNLGKSTSYKGTPGAKPLQHFQSMSQQTSPPLFPLLTWTDFGRGQVQNSMMRSAWQLLIYHHTVSTCGYLGQTRNNKKMSREKAECTSVSKDSRRLAAPVPRGCYV